MRSNFNFMKLVQVFVKYSILIYSYRKFWEGSYRLRRTDEVRSGTGQRGDWIQERREDRRRVRGKLKTDNFKIQNPGPSPSRNRYFGRVGEQGYRQTGNGRKDIQNKPNDKFTIRCVLQTQDKEIVITFEKPVTKY